MQKDTKVEIRISTEEKERYRELSESHSRYDSLSHFFRIAALEEASEESDIDTEEIVGRVEGAVSGTSERLDSIEQELYAIKEEISDDSDVTALGARLVEELPELNDGSEFDWHLDSLNEENGIVPENVHARPDTIEEAREWSTARAWADYLDESHETVLRALSWAEDNFAHVQRASPPEDYPEWMDADDRYYKMVV